MSLPCDEPTRSGLPSSLTSPIAMADEICLGVVTIAVWNVPSPLPRNTLNWPV